MLIRDHSAGTHILHENFGTGRYRVEVLAIVCGQDVVVVIHGGTRPHIGATALAVPRPSLLDSSQISSSASVLCVVGHKEDELARHIALKLSTCLNCTVTVVAGIHIDDVSENEINILMENSRHVLERLTDRLQNIENG